MLRVRGEWCKYGPTWFELLSLEPSSELRCRGWKSGIVDSPGTVLPTSAPYTPAPGLRAPAPLGPVLWASVKLSTVLERVLRVGAGGRPERVVIAAELSRWWWWWWCLCLCGEEELSSWDDDSECRSWRAPPRDMVGVVASPRVGLFPRERRPPPPGEGVGGFAMVDGLSRDVTILGGGGEALRGFGGSGGIVSDSSGLLSFQHARRLRGQDQGRDRGQDRGRRGPRPGAGCSLWIRQCRWSCSYVCFLCGSTRGGSNGGVAVHKRAVARVQPRRIQARVQGYSQCKLSC